MQRDISYTSEGVGKSRSETGNPVQMPSFQKKRLRSSKWFMTIGPKGSRVFHNVSSDRKIRQFLLLPKERIFKYV